MKLLALDAAGNSSSVALSIDGQIGYRDEPGEGRGGRQLIAMSDVLLADAGLPLALLDAIVFGCGPGAFTGVRLAAGVAQGLAFGADLGVIPVSDLAMLAQGAHREQGAERLMVCVDARMNEVFSGAFRIGAGGLAGPVDDERLSAPDDLELPDSSPWFGVGSGWAVYADTLVGLNSKLSGCEPQREPHARDACALAARACADGKILPPESALPVYLRGKTAWKKPVTTL